MHDPISLFFQQQIDLRGWLPRGRLKTRFRILSPGRGRRIIARGERSEPLVRKIEIRAPKGRKAFSFNIFRPFRAPSNANSYQGFASLTPGYYRTAPAGLMHFCLRFFSFETASGDPSAQFSGIYAARCRIPLQKSNHLPIMLSS